MPFHEDGQFEGEIVGVQITDSPFAKDDRNACAVALEIKSPEGSDIWYGELSEKYGSGNAAGKTSTDITLSALSGIGWEGDINAGYDAFMESLENLLGKTIPFTVTSREYDNKTYYQIKYIGSGGSRAKALSADEAKSRFSAIVGVGGGGAPEQSAQPATTKTTAKKSPFD